MNFWALFIGGVLAGIPHILQSLVDKGKLIPLRDLGHWPMHLAFGLLGIIAAISIWRKHEAKHVQIAWPVVLWLGFVLWAWLAPGLVDLYSIAEWKYSSGRLTLYLGFLLLGSAWFVSGRNRERDFYQFILGFAGWLSIDYVFRFLSAGAEALHDPYIVPGLMGHKNFTSSAIALSLTFVFIGWRKGFFGTRWALSVLCTGALAIVMAQTRSIWLGSAVAVGIGALLGFVPKGSFRKIIIGAIGLVGLFLLSSPVQKRVMDPSNLKIRKVFWEHSLQMSAEYPLTGVGPGQWRIHFPKYGLTGMNPSVAEGETAEVRPHNDFIWILSEMGSVGLLFFVGFFVMVGWFALKRYRAQPKELEQSAWLSILALVLIYASFEFPIERAAFFIPFIFMVGKQINGGIRLPMKGVLIATIGILGAGTLVAWKATKADQQNELIHIQNAQIASELGRVNSVQDPEIQKALIEKTIPKMEFLEQNVLESYSEWNEMDIVGNPLMYFAGMASLIQEKSSFGPNATFTSENFIKAEEYFNQALEIHPYHVVTLYQLANLHRYRNDHESAKGVYERLLAISPRHPGGQLHYAVTLNALGDYEGAARVLVSAFLPKSYYGSPDRREYWYAVVEALRKMPNQVKHEGLKPFLISRNQLSDEQLFRAFQLAKEKRLEEAQKH